MLTLYKVRALYAYEAEQSDDLPFDVGQEINITEELDAEWYSGYYIDQSGKAIEGIFPVNFVETIENEPLAAKEGETPSAAADIETANTSTSAISKTEEITGWSDDEDASGSDESDVEIHLSAPVAPGGLTAAQDLEMAAEVEEPEHGLERTLEPTHAEKLADEQDKVPVGEPIAEIETRPESKPLSSSKPPQSPKEPALDVKQSSEAEPKIPSQAEPKQSPQAVPKKFPPKKSMTEVFESDQDNDISESLQSNFKSRMALFSQKEGEPKQKYQPPSRKNTFGKTFEPVDKPEQARRQSIPQAEDEEEDQPRVSLKERIALLQKQQEEEQRRIAEAEAHAARRASSSEKRRTESSIPPPVPQPAGNPVEEAIDEQEEDESSQSPAVPSKPAIPSYPSAPAEVSAAPQAIDAASVETNTRDPEPEASDEDEQDVDEEEAARLVRLRERMARISNAPQMGAFFGGKMPSKANRDTSAMSKEEIEREEAEQRMSMAQPVSMMGLGMDPEIMRKLMPQRPKEPEDEEDQLQEPELEEQTETVLPAEPPAAIPDKDEDAAGEILSNLSCASTDPSGTAAEPGPGPEPEPEPEPEPSQLIRRESVGPVSLSSALASDEGDNDSVYSSTTDAESTTTLTRQELAGSPPAQISPPTIGTGSGLAPDDDEYEADVDTDVNNSTHPLAGAQSVAIPQAPAQALRGLPPPPPRQPHASANVPAPAPTSPRAAPKSPKLPNRAPPVPNAPPVLHSAPPAPPAPHPPSPTPHSPPPPPPPPHMVPPVPVAIQRSAPPVPPAQPPLQVSPPAFHGKRSGSHSSGSSIPLNVRTGPPAPHPPPPPPPPVPSGNSTAPSPPVRSAPPLPDTMSPASPTGPAPAIPGGMVYHAPPPPPPPALPVHASFPPAGVKSAAELPFPLEIAQAWYLDPNGLPPLDRSRYLVEIDHSEAAKRGGRKVIDHDVYVTDASLCTYLVAIHYDSGNPQPDVRIETHPAPKLDADLLKSQYKLCGAEINNFASRNAASLDGTADSISKLISTFPQVLPPINSKCYGALIYESFGTDAITQTESLRAGDIVVLDEAKFQGHKGPLHSSYRKAFDLAVYVIAEYDGSKKRVRFYDQKKSSIRLGDHIEGSVRMYRPVSRSLVEWS